MSSTSGELDEDELREEYTQLGVLLESGVVGKYVQQQSSTGRVVELAADVASAFPSAEAVNQALRLVMELRKLPLVLPPAPAVRRSRRVPRP